MNADNPTEPSSSPLTAKICPGCGVTEGKFHAPACPHYKGNFQWPAQDANAAEKKPSSSGTSHGNGQDTFSQGGMLPNQRHPLQSPLRPGEVIIDCAPIKDEPGDHGYSAWRQSQVDEVNVGALAAASAWQAEQDAGTPAQQHLRLIEALTLQVAATNRLAASNEALVQAMAQEDGEGETVVNNYLDGKPRTL